MDAESFKPADDVDIVGGGGASGGRPRFLGKLFAGPFAQSLDARDLSTPSKDVSITSPSHDASSSESEQSVADRRMARPSSWGGGSS